MTSPQNPRLQLINFWLNDCKLLIPPQETQFLTSISTQTDLTPEQQQTLSKIEDEIQGGFMKLLYICKSGAILL